VIGCFWHGHDDPACRDGRSPRSNESYWLPKLTRNKERDAASVEALKADGWHVLVVWECETRDAEGLRARLESFLGPRSTTGEGAARIPASKFEIRGTRNLDFLRNLLPRR
jgi:DNA mismatch endonuclease, patch repair protein